MGKRRLEILEKVYKNELTPVEAELMLLGLSNVLRSNLLGVSKGDRVKCKFGNSGHKFWRELLDQLPTVDKIQFDNLAGFCRFTFLEDTREDNWFYENDFSKV